MCWFFPSASTTAKAGRHPSICHPERSRGICSFRSWGNGTRRRFAHGAFAVPESETAGPSPTLRSPGFPVEVGGAGELHAAFRNESSTCGSVRRCVAGNPGPVGMTNLRVAAHLGSGAGGGTEPAQQQPTRFRFARVLFNPFSKLRRSEKRVVLTQPLKSPSNARIGGFRILTVDNLSIDYLWLQP